jgi:transportin-3
MLMSSWQNPVHEIIQRFTRPPDRMHALIEFLTVLPEEINNKRLKLGQNRRDQLRTIFSQSSGYIVEFLEASLNKFMLQSTTADDRHTKIRLVFKCFSSWIEERLIDPMLIANSQLLVSLFQIFADPSTDLDLHDTATTCLVNMLLLYPFNVPANVFITFVFNFIPWTFV